MSEEKSITIKKNDLWKVGTFLFAILFVVALIWNPSGPTGEAVQEPGSSLKGSTFLITGDKVCTDADGKPYIILFSTTSCPHCIWIKDTFDSLANEDFADQINLQHWELDTGDNTLTPEIETEAPSEMWNLFGTYSSGGVPTFVFGCSYVRIGNGYERQNDLDAELEDFKLVINELLK